MYEIYFGSGADQVDARGDGEIDVFDDVGTSAFGSEHITVAEMVRRVQMHGELLEALEEMVANTVRLKSINAKRYDAAVAAIAKAKGTK